MPEPEGVMLDSRSAVFSAFSKAFARQNSQFEKAIQALVSLNEQISTSLALPDGEEEPDFRCPSPRELKDGGSVASRQQQALDSSMALMRRLLVDAQAKFRRMVEENKELAARIDGDIQQAQEEVALLRGELADTSRRLDQHLIAANTHLNNASSSSASSTSATAGAGVRKKQLHSVSARNLERASKMPANSSSLSTSTAAAATTRSATTTTSSSSAVKSTGGASTSASPPPLQSHHQKGSASGGMSDNGSSGVKSSATGNVGDKGGLEDDVTNTVSAGNGDKNLSETEGNGQNGRKTSYSAGEGDHDEPVFRPPSPIAGTSSQPDGAVEATPPSASSRSKNKSSGTNCDNNPAATMRLRLENERLQNEVEQLRKLVGGGISDLEGASAVVDFDDPLRIQALEIELQHAKEALAVLKADRKRLKAEKYDLLNQMKELYATLDDKEKELRDFIRNYDKIREQDASMQQLSTEREERERERWSLLRHARDEAERSLSLAAQLEIKEQQLQQLQEQLQEARRQLAAQGGGGGGGGCLSDQESLASMSISVSRVNGSSCGLTTPTCGLPGHPGLLSGHHGYNSMGLLPGDRGSCSADSGVRGSSDRESGGATSGGGNLSDSTTDGTPTMTLGGSNIEMDSISVLSSVTAPHIYQSATTPKDCSPSLSPLNANTFSKSMDSSVLSRSVEQLSSPLELEVRRGLKNPQHHPPPPPVVSQQQGRSGSRGGTWGSISRVFARSRHRKVASPSSQEEAVDPYRSWSPLTEEGYAEKLRLLREAASIPMERWRAPTVLAWLEIALGMPQYGPRCAENVKSGKVLLELSDVELEVGLGITHPMHRKKLRLAIEEHRHPALVRYPCIAQLGHTWVSSEWLPDLGLAQYSENFATNMVDARMLDHLSKKELEKFLGVTRKFHQASVVHGIHLLRMMKYDRQALAVRRHQCESIDADPLVWTNQRFIRWARNIDLGEYAENLKDSGVHGALVVLEPSFNGDTMATALGIPPSKNIIRRHLATELEALVLPARASFEHSVRISRAERRRAEKLVGGGSLGRSFSRSYAGGLAGEGGAMMQAAAPVQQLAGNEQEKERRRASLRGSLSRVLGLKLRQDSHSSRQERERDNRDRDSQTSSSSNYYVASPSSSSENSSSVVNFSCRSSPPPYHGRGSSPSRVGDHCRHPPSRVKKRHHHRRVKSIGDIDAVTITPV
ncbi:platelet binding protein GspB isoform X2 [Cryptotermes secundus]|uniref:platelet binding protein GspB isoform X2 n=1 Tax=Cryptotermes secundus TaxID=105785 RepID=UPI001454E16E|nr:platelet binding protein GspB isoform X2 [Cryptotermes secundus]